MALICFWVLFEDLLKPINVCSISSDSFASGNFWEWPFHQGGERVWVYLCHHMADVAQICSEGAEDSTDVKDAQNMEDEWSQGPSNPFLDHFSIQLDFFPYIQGAAVRGEAQERFLVLTALTGVPDPATAEFTLSVTLLSHVGSLTTFVCFLSWGKYQELSSLPTPHFL